VERKGNIYRAVRDIQLRDLQPRERGVRDRGEMGVRQIGEERGG